MEHTWLLVLLTCIGGSLACMTDPRCPLMYNHAMLISTSNPSESCRKHSQSVACYAANMAGCPFPDQMMATRYNAYYAKCSLNASDVDTCKERVGNCSVMKPSSILALMNQVTTSFGSFVNIGMPSSSDTTTPSPTDLTMPTTTKKSITEIITEAMPGFCRGMGPYLTCVGTAMASCNAKVTRYDVVGGDHDIYDKYCISKPGDPGSSDKKAKCEKILSVANCTKHLANVTEEDAANDVMKFCWDVGSYLGCFNTVFQDYCDASLNKEALMVPNMDSTFKQRCQANATALCDGRFHAAGCHEHLTKISNNTDGMTACTLMGEYIGCIDKTFGHCDQSLSKESYMVPGIDGRFKQMCTVNKTADCQGYIQKAGCHDSLKDVDSDTDISTTCRSVGTYQKCFNQVFERCDKAVSVEAVMVPDKMGGTYNQVCRANETNACKGLLQEAGCYGHLTKMSNASDLMTSCTLMGTYLGCFNFVFKRCDQTLKKESLMESWVDTKFKEMCIANKTAMCQGHLQAAGCYDSLRNLTNNTDVNVVCRQMELHMGCFDSVFPKCDKSLSKEDVMLPIVTKTYGNVCQGSSMQMCLLRVSSCLPTLSKIMKNVNNNALMCSGMNEFFTCVKGAKKNCASSLDIASIMGTFQSSYEMMCAGAGAGADSDSSCPAATQCLKPLVKMNPQSMMSPNAIMSMFMSSMMMPSTGQGGQLNFLFFNPDVMKNCSLVTDCMNCMNRELKKCNQTSPSNNSHEDVTKSFSRVCNVLSKDQNLMTCGQMGSCMSSLPMPASSLQTTSGTDNSQMWCSLIEASMMCAATSTKCKGDRTVFMSMIGDMSQVCPGIRQPYTRPPLKVDLDNGVGPALGGGLLTVLIVASVMIFI